MSKLHEAAHQVINEYEAGFIGVSLDKAIYNLKAALAEPQDEPVAKVEVMTTGGNAGLATRIVEIDDYLRERLRPGQMLYTHPAPQREPLTDAEVDELSREMVKCNKSVNWLCRAIEKAHGIGGQDE